MVLLSNVSRLDEVKADVITFGELVFWTVNIKKIENSTCTLAKIVGSSYMRRRKSLFRFSVDLMRDCRVEIPLTNREDEVSKIFYYIYLFCVSDGFGSDFYSHVTA